MASLFETDIESLKGVGPKRAKLFRKLGAGTVGALLCFYPRAYEDWSHPYSIAAAPFGEVCCVRAAVASRVSEHRIRKGMTLYKLRACDGLSALHITFFNNRFAADRMKEGEEFLFYGRVGGAFTKREMLSPTFQPALSAASVHPVYRQTEGLSSRQIEAAVRQAAALLPETVGDPIPESCRRQYGLCGLREALLNIHFPDDPALLEAAKRRLVFEELLTLQLGMMRLKGRRRCENTCRLREDHSADFFSLLPFSPTGAQRRAVREGIADMRGCTPMNRLVQGDVGSGKTAVAAALCYSAAREGMQCALMAPTEILAEQHYHSMEALFAPAGLRVGLLTGSIPAAARRALLSRLEAGEIDLLVGTHALLSEGVSFARLGLVVTDEQHRFGVQQRAALASKGDHPHLLVMSATPIPRTLALIIYGDLDVSMLDELPPGRQKIATYHIGSDKRERAFAFLKKHLDEGRQGYIVCPLVSENEQENMASAEEYADRLRSGALKGYRIGLLHGRMKPREKEAVMRAFAGGDIQLLVSTTVIEVGIDVPNAVIMMIENAERFGLSQLHQLRGRVGRGKHPSYCILLSDAQNEEAVARLKIMCATNDGFRIADEDLKLRGPGDFFGARQHGLPDLKIADMMGDSLLLEQAQSAAREIVQGDPQLDAPEHRMLRAQVARLFQSVGEEGLN